ncbi:recombinase family protein [Sphingomonas sp. 1P06PA]|uniref:recombinase family protein n=1 Tax=Sphingomonas sp. 1P06PA TaxID=554121 RepID=UPI0039A42D5C
MRDAYDDGGFSGGNMNRPGLTRLLADVQLGKVDVVVVYKVDRLTRALSDFAKIVEILDARGASFVSVTQSFNTTSSMGRLTLNVLLSFAQFEREVTGERIRDKIAQSKARGMWMGGPVPLGYRVANRMLLVDESDAETVRHIYRRYLALGSGSALIEELRADGYRTKLRQTSAGPRGGVPFSRGMLFALLSNRIYLGEIVHKGVAHPGDHDAIISTELWVAVQAQVAAKRNGIKARGHSETYSLLAGIIRDGLGRRMSPSHAVRSGRRYRYYVTHASELITGGPDAWRMPAQDVELIVLRQLRQLLGDRKRIANLAGDGEAGTKSVALATAEQLTRKLDASHSRRALVASLVTGVTVRQDEVEVVVDPAALLRTLGLPEHVGASPNTIVAPAVRIRRGKDVKLVLADASGSATRRDDQLVGLIAESRSTRELLLANPALTITQLCTQHRLCRKRVAKLIRLSFLSPQLADQIVAGKHPARITARRLLDAELPLWWDQQERLLLSH